jgi:hypothetical protein
MMRKERIGLQGVGSSQVSEGKEWTAGGERREQPR